MRLGGRSHLFQRVASFLLVKIDQYFYTTDVWFSSLSESGFIPTYKISMENVISVEQVLISFREWLHSYTRWWNV